jgi:hypothetical protein
MVDISKATVKTWEISRQQYVMENQDAAAKNMMTSSIQFQNLPSFICIFFTPSITHAAGIGPSSTTVEMAGLSLYLPISQT